jgi:hypothetical protein
MSRTYYLSLLFRPWPVSTNCTVDSVESSRVESTVMTADMGQVQSVNLLASFSHSFCTCRVTTHTSDSYHVSSWQRKSDRPAAERKLARLYKIFGLYKHNTDVYMWASGQYPFRVRLIANALGEVRFISLAPSLHYLATVLTEGHYYWNTHLHDQSIQSLRHQWRIIYANCQ